MRGTENHLAGARNSATVLIACAEWQYLSKTNTSGRSPSPEGIAAGQKVPGLRKGNNGHGGHSIAP